MTETTKPSEISLGKEGLAILGCWTLGCAGVVAVGVGVIYVVMWAIGAGWRAGFGA